jgi:hypothetical protein
MTARFPDIREAHMFGSRAYGTNSLRSDLDLLLVVDRPLQQREILEIQQAWRIIDFWETGDGRMARSLINGSSIVSRDRPLVEKLEAKQLWVRGAGFAEFSAWTQASTYDANFGPSLATEPDIDIYRASIAKAHEIAARRSLPFFVFGYDWHEVAGQVVNSVQRVLARYSYLSNKAKILPPKSLLLETEYDLQNLVQFSLAGVIHDLEPEPFVIKVADQEKNADFVFAAGKFVIEAKSITDASSRAAVLKMLDGLRGFYEQNPKVEFLLFLILVTDKADDDATLEARFSDTSPKPKYAARIVRTPR